MDAPGIMFRSVKASVCMFFPYKSPQYRQVHYVMKKQGRKIGCIGQEDNLQYSQCRIITVSSQQASCLSCPQNIYSPKIWGLLLPAKSFAIDTNQFIFLHQKVNGISQSNSGIDMFLYNRFITERRIV